MPTSYFTSRKLPLDRIPAAQRPLTEKAIEEHDARERKASESRGGKAESVVEDARRRLHDLLGADNHASLRDAMTAERTALRTLRQPPTGLDLDLDKANAARKRTLDAVLSSLGVDPQQLAEIGRATNEQIMDVLGTPVAAVTPGFSLRHNLEKWTELSPLHKFPLDWGVRPPINITDPNQWQIFGPDFPLWNTAYDSVESSGFRVRRDVTLNEQYGLVGNVTQMDCNDAGSFDLAQAIVDTEVVFIYEAPATGRLEVIVDATNLDNRHQLRISDEWGWSEHWTNQNNYLSLNVFHPSITERSLVQMSNFYREGNEDNSWDESPLAGGEHYYAHMLSNGAVQAGETFFVGVGTRTFDITRANDVEVHSASTFQWFIRSVEVRVVP
jgi:hypothetical protein